MYHARIYGRAQGLWFVCKMFILRCMLIESGYWDNVYGVLLYVFSDVLVDKA